MTRRDYSTASDPCRNPHFSRLWTEPEPIDDLAGKIVEKTGRAAVLHWLEQAESLQGADRTAALECADEIREICGLRWADLFGDRRAA